MIHHEAQIKAVPQKLKSFLHHLPSRDRFVCDGLVFKISELVTSFRRIEESTNTSHEYKKIVSCRLNSQERKKLR